MGEQREAIEQDVDPGLAERRQGKQLVKVCFPLQKQIHDRLVESLLPDKFVQRSVDLERNVAARDPERETKRGQDVPDVSCRERAAPA